MNKQELLGWLEKYNREEDQKDRLCEIELGAILNNKKELSKQDFIRLLEWKFGTYPARLKREKNLAEQMTDDFIKKTVKEALYAEDEKERTEKLFKIKGVKNAVASVILTFYDPKNYGVFDIHAWRELFGKEPEGFSSSSKRLMEFLKEIRKLAVQYQMNARDIEKALYKKNYDESK